MNKYENTEKLTNNKTSVVYDKENKIIHFYDLTDNYNDTKGFTRNSRGIEKAWNNLVMIFSDDMTMYQVMDALDGYKLNTHSYCGMD